MFKKLLASVGVGAAQVETVLQNPDVHPGGAVQGTIHLEGGQVPQDINGISVALVARVEVEAGDHEVATNMVAHQKPVTGAFQLAAGQRHDIPFALEVPWEMPVSAIAGTPLRGMAVGVSTQLDIAGAVDKGDLDPIQVHPLPSQKRLLDAFVNLGFRFRRADLEQGRVRGTSQALPFYQEIEFAPGGDWARRINELEVTFVTGPQQIEVVLEIDKRRLLGSTDTFHHFAVPHQSVGQVAWEQEIGQTLQRLVG